MLTVVPPAPPEPPDAPADDRDAPVTRTGPGVGLVPAEPSPAPGRAAHPSSGSDGPATPGTPTGTSHEDAP